MSVFLFEAVVQTRQTRAGVKVGRSPHFLLDDRLYIIPSFRHFFKFFSFTFPALTIFYSINLHYPGNTIDTQYAEQYLPSSKWPLLHRHASLWRGHLQVE